MSNSVISVHLQQFSDENRKIGAMIERKRIVDLLRGLKDECDKFGDTTSSDTLEEATIKILYGFTK